MKRFAEWLRYEMERRGLGVRDLSTLSGISAATVSRLLLETRKPGPEVCRKLARALDLPEVVVFAQAGLLELPRGREASFLELWEVFRFLPVEEQRAILAEARKRAQRYGRTHKSAGGATGLGPADDVDKCRG